VDVAVVETGMGGRLDATNIVDPMLSVITNVAREHTTVLGETPEQIAYEIAGIIDTAPVVSGATGEPSDVIDAVAEAAEVPVNEVPGRASIVHDDRQALTLAIDGTPVETGLLGRYQVDNVDTVLEAVETIPLPVPDAAVRDALGGVQIPGRMEPVADAPLVLLDGAHNPAAVDRLPATLDRIDCDTVVAVVSIMADKEYGEMLSTIDGFADDIILSEAGIDRAADPADLAAALDAEPVVESSIPAALRAAADTAAPRDAVLVTGSLYFVGDVKETIEQRPEIIAART
ncbi:MAG: cyanophycin synthetase, partial [Candidatus Nanohaloarchaea archaeon]|nr:cyanophycin synthetase [Candidatus Nanohaloarchaea archaeon]